ncbi:MAG TPA: hypothetical protein VM899_16210 [Rubellimicrobium sp.]|jgi:hypothetical protein|nr:hypothetical protein [Rubellimicrobium sp.]
MKKLRPGSGNDDWLERYFPKLQAGGADPSKFRPVLSPTEEKAEKTARAARELIEAENEARRAAAARLRAARLGKQADGHMDAAREQPNQKEGPDTKA